MIDGVRLKLQVFETELYNCFKNTSEEEFYDNFNTTPEQGFMDTLVYWNKISIDKIYSEVIDAWGQQYYDDIFASDKRNTMELFEEIKKDMFEWLYPNIPHLEIRTFMQKRRMSSDILEPFQENIDLYLSPSTWIDLFEFHKNYLNEKEILFLHENRLRVLF
jgi:hypothetical protein